MVAFTIHPRDKNSQAESVLAGGNGNSSFKLQLGQWLYLFLLLWCLSVRGGGSSGGIRALLFCVGSKLCDLYIYKVWKEATFSIHKAAFIAGTVHYTCT
jgi:hypothetical protein